MATYDPYWDNVVLLAAMDGTDGSTVFIDASDSSHTLTANGNAQLDAAQFKFGATSGLYDGTGDSTSAADHIDFEFGADEFTVEAWVRFNSTLVEPWVTIVSKWDTAGNRKSWALFYDDTTNTLKFYTSTDGSTTLTRLNISWTHTANTWYHIACDKDSTDKYRLYVDGTMIGSATAAETLSNETSGVYIGGQADTTVNYFTGHIDDVRITKGIARYASDGGFTVPVAAHHTAGDVVKGDPNWPYVVLSTTFNGTTGSRTFVDRSDSAHVLTAVGGAKVTNDELDVSSSTSDIITIPNSADFQFGSGDFTIDFDITFSTAATPAATEYVVNLFNPTGNQKSWAVAWTTADELVLYTSTDGSTTDTRIAVPYVPVVGQKRRMRVQKKADVYRWFQNGTQIATATQAETLFASTAVLGIGAFPSITGRQFSGSVDNLRVLKGIGLQADGSSYSAGTAEWFNTIADPFWDDCVYFPSFVGPNGSTTIVDQSDFNSTTTLFDQAQIQNNELEIFSSFDQTQLLPFSELDMGAGAFTFAMIVEPDTLGNYRTLVSSYDAPPGRSWWMYITSTGSVGFNYSTDGTNASGFGTGAGVLATNTASEIVFERNASGVMRWYKDGVFLNKQTDAADIFPQGTKSLRLGVKGEAPNDYYNGTYAQFKFWVGSAVIDSDSGYDTTTSTLFAPRGEYVDVVPFVPPTAVDFHDVQFPAVVSYGSSGGPVWTDEVITLVSGYEERNTSHSEPVRAYNASVGIKNMDELYEVQEFMTLRQGRVFGFRWKDWADFRSGPPLQQVTNADQLLGTGDGVETVFQLVINQTDAGASRTRVITKPVNGTVVVAVDGVAKVELADYTVDYTTGKITFNAAVADTLDVTAGFEFDVPVRFVQQRLEINLDYFESGIVPNVNVKEVKVDPNA